MQTFVALRRFAAAAALLALVACGADSPASTRDAAGAGPISLRVRNTGTVSLTNISILVAENADKITIARLAPGEMSASFARPAAHENPSVSLTADGHDYASLPVEGFAGFNPALADGRYTITIQPIVVEGYKALDVRTLKDD